MADKIGVFICTGYGIAEALDVDALGRVATEECSAAFCKTVGSCEGSALASICEDIKSENLTKVVLAGISPRRYAEHAFPEGVIVEKFALRETATRLGFRGISDFIRTVALDRSNAQ